MSSSSRSRASISKQRGAAMSSRLIPPYAGAIARTILTISSVSWVSSTTGQASTPPNRLNSAALPSITGMRRGRADVAQAEHRRAVGDHRDRVALDGQPARVRRVLGDRHADPGHPRRVRPGQLVPVAQRDLGVHLDLAAQVQQERAVGHLADVHPVQLLELLDHLVGVARVGGVAGEVDEHVGGVGVDHVEGGHDRAGLADAGGEPADGRGVRGNGDPDRDRESCARQAGGHHGVSSDVGGWFTAFLLVRNTGFQSGGYW